MTKLSIIIPVYNNCEYTRKALSGLSKLEIPHEVIIVDNGSTDKTSEVVSSFSGIIYIKNKENVGFSKANNIGLARAKGEYILFLNNDIRVDMMHDRWPSLLFGACDTGAIIGVQSGRLDDKHNPIGEGVFDPEVKGGYLSGWCLMAKRETWKKVAISPGQVWNEKFFLYYEDGDLSFRAKKKGIPLLVGAVPVHHYSRVTGRKYNMFYYLKKSKRIFKKIWPEII